MFADVTVVIPCYRCAATVARAVASVAVQTILPAEVILVDDASGDGTIDVLKSLKKLYGDWIRIVELPNNVGAASARNAGWNLATQPYIAFLDADDAWHQRKIEIQNQYMRDNPKVVMSGHLFSELSQRAVDTLSSPVELKSVKKITWAGLVLKNQFVTPSVMIKSDIPFRFSDGKHYMEDHLLWLEIVGAGLLAVKLDIELATIFKPMYGASGLSSNMWLMEKAELSNYRYLYKQKRLKFHHYIFLLCFSIAKYFRRLLIVHMLRPIFLFRNNK